MITLLTPTIKQHGISQKTIESVSKYAEHLPWVIKFAPEIKWEIGETINQVRQTMLPYVTTDYIFWLDSDDELANSLPDTSSFNNKDVIIFDLDDNGVKRRYIQETDYIRLFGTLRLVLKTSFMEKLSIDFTKNGIHREDLFMFHQALESDFIYCPISLIKKNGDRFPKIDLYKKRDAEQHKNHWSKIFTRENIDLYNQKIKDNMITLAK